jgi:hypothetical protein
MFQTSCSDYHNKNRWIEDGHLHTRRRENLKTCSDWTQAQRSISLVPKPDNGTYPRPVQSSAHPYNLFPNLILYCQATVFLLFLGYIILYPSDLTDTLIVAFLISAKYYASQLRVSVCLLFLLHRRCEVLKAVKMSRLVFGPEDEDGMFLRKFGMYLQVHTALLPRRQPGTINSNV